MFHLKSPYTPSGDQPFAIDRLQKGIASGKHYQTLLGVTGSGKTFTVANVIAHSWRPALVLSHNKTLAAQLYEEFRDFFPENAVRYFVSYYDYYQPEAYIPNTDTYIEKDAKINTFIDELRHAATQTALSRRDFIIVASVSAIYGIGDPEDYLSLSCKVKRGTMMPLKMFLKQLSEIQYVRNDIERIPGTWSKKGERIAIIPASGDEEIVIRFFGNEIEEIEVGQNKKDEVHIFPAKHFVTREENIKRAIKNIKAELKERHAELRHEKKVLEAERLLRRTRYDIQMLKETGYTTGIENYSRHISGRKQGEPPTTLLDYLPKDTLIFIDESHMTIPQIRGMYHGDRARKTVLVEHGFRLPSALDNRPLTYAEFIQRTGTTIYISATPGLYEKTKGPLVEQLVRPTGLLDPTIEIRPAQDQVKDAEREIVSRVKRRERTLVVALTKRMAEDIAEFLSERGLRIAWIHSDVKTPERSRIINQLRSGAVDAIVGINLLREGLDLPEVSLVCILDADKEGFLRNETTLVQTIGRASRNVHGHVILYGDTITDSMKKAVSETKRRRRYQETYNKKHNIAPTPLVKEIRDSLFKDAKKISKKSLLSKFEGEKRSKTELKREVEAEMLEEASRLNFEKAAELRDLLKSLH